MREIREYNMNGTIILGVDNGYGNVKTAHRVFPTGIVKSDSEPVLSKEYIDYDGAYYILLVKVTRVLLQTSRRMMILIF